MTFALGVYSEMNDVRPPGVEGWLTAGQAAMLAAVAAACPPDGEIVEIGSFRGLSTIVLAAHAPEGAAIVAIDPHAGNDRGPGELDGYGAEAAADRLAFEDNLVNAGVRHRVRHVQIDLGRSPRRRARRDRRAVHRWRPSL